jgi:hypothetical protein
MKPEKNDEPGMYVGLRIPYTDISHIHGYVWPTDAAPDSVRVLKESLGECIDVLVQVEKDVAALGWACQSIDANGFYFDKKCSIEEAKKELAFLADDYPGELMLEAFEVTGDTSDCDHCSPK